MLAFHLPTTVDKEPFMNGGQTGGDAYAMSWANLTNRKADFVDLSDTFPHDCIRNFGAKD